MTISGGKRAITLSKNALRSWLANRIMQSAMGNQNNDGLVTERSVDMHSNLSISSTHQYIHFNSYPYYHYLNHSNLKENQSLALEIADWFNTL